MTSPVHPTLAVIIPTYNMGHYLAECLASVLAQTYTRLEILVVDDGSTDDSVAVAERYAPRVNLHRHSQNLGLSAVRNSGLTHTQAPYVIFLDADDQLLDTDFLASAVGELLARKQLCGVIGGWRRVDAAGVPLNDVTLWQQAPDLTPTDWFDWAPVLLSATVLRRECLPAENAFDTALPFAQDVAAVLSMVLNGAQFRWLPRMAVAYRQHGGSISQRSAEQRAAITWQVWQNLLNDPRLPPEIAAHKRQILFDKLVWQLTWLCQRGEYSIAETYRDMAIAHSPHRPTPARYDLMAALIHHHRQQHPQPDEAQISAAIAALFPTIAERERLWWQQVWSLMHITRQAPNAMLPNLAPRLSDYPPQQVPQMAVQALQRGPSWHYGSGQPLAVVLAEFTRAANLSALQNARLWLVMVARARTLGHFFAALRGLLGL